MIRPFNLRDLPLVYRLSDKCISLHAQFALISKPHPLRGALTNMLVGGRFPTYVWKAAKGEAAAFVQFHLEEHSPNAQIVYLATEGTAATSDGNNKIAEDIWLPLIDQLVSESGRRGLHSLVAEVNETGEELPLLRRAGFAVYTRQDIWVADQTENKQRPAILTSRKHIDDWDIQLLYANIVPRLIQLVEPIPPLRDGESWILRENGELTALVHFQTGPAATWLRFFIHPSAQASTEEIVEAALRVKQARPDHPIYCCVRRYQSWLQSALERAGFRLWGSQAVMVKHTVQHIQASLPDLATVLEAKGISGSTPLIQRYNVQKHRLQDAGNGYR